MENQGRKKRRLQRTKSNRESWCSSSLDANTIFALMLAATCNSNKPYSESLIKRCLNSLHLSLIPNSQNAAVRLHQTLPIPILSLLPVLLNSKCDEIVSRSAKIAGAASIVSFEMNEQIALDGEIVKGLILAVRASNKMVSVAACNAVLDLSTTSFGRERLLQFSALEHLMWEGFAHVALHCWNQSLKPIHYTSVDPLSEILSVMSVNLLHVAIRLIGDSDPTFRKACLVAAITLPSDSKCWLDLNQRTIFSYMIDKICSESGFLEALRVIEVAIQKNEDPFQRLRWLQLLNWEAEMIEEHGGDFPSVGFENLSSLFNQHRNKAEVAFMHVKSKFCCEVIFEDVIDSYVMVLEKYKKTRKQYMNGMLSLHCK